MLDPITISLIQQEQRRDLLKQLDQAQRIQAAGLHQAGLWRLPPQVTAWLGQRLVVWGLKLQPAAPALAGCCIPCGPQSSCAASLHECA